MKKMIVILLLSSTYIFASGTQRHFNPGDGERLIKEIDILKKGRRISAELMTHLGSALKESIKKNGFVKSVEVCSLKVLPMTEKIRKKYKLKSIKRISTKTRNINNAPDKLDQIAIDYLKKEKKSSYLQQQVKSGKFFYRFYRSIGIKDTCLNCHGTRKDMKIMTRSKIAKIYPNDKALDYKIGDFRGVIRLEF
ncbi:MAG: hypothetical protein COB02_09930 [Candidatus Cloacimonadota bacterium]|nr:MAG: hypothetical protein COB02_09930 [Candidatus Cloacimonadota bacterium]